MVLSEAKRNALNKLAKSGKPIPVSVKSVKKNFSAPRPPRDNGLPEKKFLSVNNNAQSMSSTGAVILLNGMGQGNTQTSRVGLKISLRSLQYRLRINQQSSAGSLVNCIVRVMLVYDREPDGALPALTGVGSAQTGILDSAVTTGGATVNTNEPLWIPNGKRYIVLSDKTMAIQAGSTIANSYTMKKYKKLSTFTEYNSANSAIADINSGALYLVYMSDVASGAGEPTVTYTTRIRYTDA